MNPYEKPDYYSKKAMEEGYYARSVYKLMEIQDKFNLIKEGQKLLDLGSAPGSWLQYISKIIGDSGLAVGIDFKEVKAQYNNVKIIKGNFLKDHKKAELVELAPYDGILSDMAPDTKGDKLVDCYASGDLVRDALMFSYNFLKKGGYFIAKIFQGGDEKEIMDEIKLAFKTAKWFKPKSCRKKSVEIFMIGMDFTGKPDIKDATDIIENAEETGEMPW